MKRSDEVKVAGAPEVDRPSRHAERVPGDDSRVDAKNLDLDGMRALAASLGEPVYRGMQLYRWVHLHGAVSFGDMTDLPKSFRRALDARACIGAVQAVDVQTGGDETAKMLLELPSGRRIEAVLIPDVRTAGAPGRLTACVSSQVGCAMACAFCATGLMGFQENLTAGAIVDQVRMLDGLAKSRYGRGLSNVVYMGMGEPLLNYRSVVLSIRLLSDPALLGLAPRRLTVSTVGLARRIRQLADDCPRVGLAVSLHAPSQQKRDRIMPSVRSEATDLSALREALSYYTGTTGRGVTFEYCLFRGFNDTEADARQLAAFSNAVPSKVNLIEYNPVAGLPFERTPESDLHAFIRVLVSRGVTVTVRRSRGRDIDAACGQLALLRPPGARAIPAPPA